MSRTATDGTRRPTAPGSGLGASRWLERLPVRDLHGRMETAELPALPVSPEARDLDADGIFHLTGLHGRAHGILPSARRRARRLAESNDARGRLRSSCGHRVLRRSERAWQLAARDVRSWQPAMAGSVAELRSRAAG